MREPKISLVNGLWAQIKIDLYRQYKYTASSYTISIPHLSQKVSFMVGPSKARHGSLVTIRYAATWLVARGSKHTRSNPAGTGHIP